MKRNYLILGASSGIGQQISIDLSKEGHQVFGTYRRKEPDNPITGVRYHQVDVSSESITFDYLPDTLNGLVYCPGSIVLKPFAQIKPLDFAKDFDLQVIGAIRCIQACLPRLRKAESASVLLFSSVAAQQGLPFHSQVSASKAAIEGLTRALAAELAPHIRVNCIAPSVTDTPLAAFLLNQPQKVEALHQRHPLKRIGKAEDIAAMAGFLLSDRAAWISGQVMAVDGGISTLRV